MTTNHDQQVDDIIDALLDVKYNWIRTTVKLPHISHYHISDGITPENPLCGMQFADYVRVEIVDDTTPHDLFHVTNCPKCVKLIKLNYERYGYKYGKL